MGVYRGLELPSLAQIMMRIILYILGGVAVLVLISWGVSSWRVSNIEKQRDEQKQIAAQAAAEAELHRKNEAELEKKIAARDLVIAAKDELIAANSKQSQKVNDEIQSENARFEAERDSGDDLNIDELRARICARLRASKINAPEFCAGQQR